MIDTLGSLKADVLDWLEESTLSQSRVNGAINDGIESLWETLIRVCVSLFMNGPVTISVASGAERVFVTTVTDPSVAPTVTDVVDGALLQHTVVVAYTLVTESGTETLPSPATTHVTAANNVASVAAPAFVANAIGWNCYMGSSSARLAKQNDEPIDFANTFQEPTNGEIDLPNRPTVPTQNTTGDDICYIRHLECQMPDSTYKKYAATDIDSLLMQRAAGSIATTSQYQNYYWDLINQQQLEFRPTPAIGFTPRYFYIKRPRRLRFDSAPLPFLTFPSIAFLRSFALSRLSLSIREFESAEAWDKVSETERSRCELAVLQMNQPRNQYITPY